MPAAPSDRAILKKLVSNFQTREEEPIRPMLDQYLMERDRSNRRVRVHNIDMRPRLRPGGRFSPSSLCGCLRAASFKFVGMPARVRIDPDLELIFEDGNWRHHKWQAIFLDMEAVLGRERFRVRSFEALIEIPELYIAGNSDEVVSIERKKRVIDFKGINDAGFNRVSASDEPIPEHVRQLMPYLKGHGIPKGSLFYDNKNTQRTKIFSLEFDDNIMYEIEEWVGESLDFLHREKVPPMHPECVAGNYLYQKCVYAHICYGSATPVRIQKKMYKDFPGVDEAWEASRQLLQEDES